MARVGTSPRTAFDHDPFAGDDALWLEEELLLTPRRSPAAPAGTVAGVSFVRGLLLALALSALVWLLFAATAVAAYRHWA